jgi:C-5 cytosine-specific DNA methylase
MKPLAIDLYCGLGGWAEGFLAEGYRVIGFDVERHDYGTGGYPGELVLRDVRSIHGSEFRDAAVIVASPPCQEYSYRAMPWKRAKALPPPDNSLFDACFRIQREASETAGRYIPLIVENVRGAQKWVGRARWHFGSYYLWGDVPALMPPVIAHKVSGFRFDGVSHGSFQSAAVKVVGHLNVRDGYPHTRHLTNQAEHVKVGGHARFKQTGETDRRLTPWLPGQAKKANGGWFNATYAERKASGKGHLSNMFASGSNSRKAASALIAKIPFPLAQHIARSFKPENIS